MNFRRRAFFFPSSERRRWSSVLVLSMGRRRLYMKVLSKNRMLARVMLQSFAACLALFSASALAAQDVAITNVRIIVGNGVGNGAVIPSGTIIVRGGKIASVSAGS